MDLQLSQVPPGTSLCIVARVLAYDGDDVLCAGFSPSQTFKLSGAPSGLQGDYTFYEIIKSSDDASGCIFGADSDALPHLSRGPFSHVTMMDCCSGIGGFTMGSQILGIQTLAFIDKNQLACDVLQANFQAPVLRGDLADPKVIRKAHAFKGHHLLQLTGGFPCQGFSRQGDMQGMGDLRSHALYHLLYAAWLLQADELLLECVANVTQFPAAQECIDRHAELAGMHVTKLVFDLQDQWPVRRNRFWCRLAKHASPQIDLVPWPTTSTFTHLGAVMPLDSLWDEWTEDQLAWTATEQQLYLDPQYGADQRILLPLDKAPTVLHSWGNVANDCPCGCRPSFSHQRLRSGGARGFGLISEKTGQHRHLHPEEGSVLCTVLPTFRFPIPPRSALALLGQIAAPLQVLWLQAQILAGLQNPPLGMDSCGSDVCHPGSATCSV